MKDGIGTDIRTRAALAVSKIRWNKKLIFRARFHQLQSLGPALDNAIDRKGGRRAALVGTIELGPVDQGSAVIDLDGVSLFWRGAGTFFQNLVLQTTGGGFNSFFGFVLREKLFSFLGILFAGCLSGRGLFSEHVLLESAHHFFYLFVSQERLGSRDPVVHAFSQEGFIDVNQLALEGGANIQANAVADLVLLIFEPAAVAILLIFGRRALSFGSGAVGLWSGAVGAEREWRKHERGSKSEKGIFHNYDR